MPPGSLLKWHGFAFNLVGFVGVGFVGLVGSFELSKRWDAALCKM